jgi:hypothetical protein
MGYGPIQLAHSSGQEQAVFHWQEAASQTFNEGVPLRISSGNAVACDTNDPWGAADVVLGISAEAGKNLSGAGVVDEGTSYATPRNQPNAKTIAVGTPFKIGTVMFYRADGLNVFRASFAAGQVFAQSLIIPGTFYALKRDATTGFWYVDNTDTSGNNAVVEIVGPVDGDTTSVLFKFKASQRYF